MLEYASDSEYSSIVSWLEDGRGFAIQNKDELLTHIVPKFFKQTKFRSFTRQLNLWGFKRLSVDGPNRGTWYHKHFSRGNVDELRSIQRVEVKNIKLKIESHKPKTSKPKKERRNTRPTKKDSQNVTRVISSAESTNVGFSSTTTAEGEGGTVPTIPPILNAASTSTSNLPENVFIHPMNQPLTSNSDFRLPFLTETIKYESVAPCHQPSNTLPSCFVNERQIPCQIPPFRSYFNSASMDTYMACGNMAQPQHMTSYHGNRMHHVQHEHDIQPLPMTSTTTTNEDDLLFLLSGIFGGEESSQDDDLSSILSLNEDVYEDFVNPIRL